MTINEALLAYQQRNVSCLTDWLDKLQPGNRQTLINAMHYSLLLGGKRVRPFLVYATGHSLGVKLTNCDAAASAIECIHAYSLIHDDLPAMDNDELRRGQPTCHIKYGDATAILAGDALQSLAFRILAEGELSKAAEPFRVKMLGTLASAAHEMCLGQSLDLQAENTPVTLTELEHIHRLKTGEIIRAAVKLGAYCAGEKGIEVLPYLDNYAKAIGLAFQVQDDVLDIISNTATLGKPQGSDEKLNKSTYPMLLGLEGAIDKANRLKEEALDALRAVPYETNLLEQFARYTIERRH